MKRESIAGFAGAIAVHGIVFAVIAAFWKSDYTPPELAFSPVSVSFLDQAADAASEPPPAAQAQPTPAVPQPTPEQAATPQPMETPVPDQTVVEDNPMPPADAIPVIEHTSETAAAHSAPSPAHHHAHPAKPTHVAAAHSAVATSNGAGNGAAGANGSGGGSNSTARYLTNPHPIYPAEASHAGQQGVVMLDVTVSPGGRVTDVSIIHSSGYALLDEAAIKAVRVCEFSPARSGGVPIEGHVHVPVRFSLTG